MTTAPCVLTKDDPNWKFALGANPTTGGHIVTVTAENGVSGWGYASASPHMGEPMEKLEAALNRFRPIVEGADPAAIHTICAGLDDEASDERYARAGLENALWDLSARLLDVPLHRLFGGAGTRHFPVLRILAIKTPEEMAEQAQKLVDQGYRYLKIKVEGDVDLDIKRVAAIRAQVGPEINLTIDANQSYAPADAIAAINGMAASRIDLVEQPVAQDDFDGLKRVTDAVDVPVEADEAANSLDDIAALVKGEMVDAVSLKVSKFGGLWNTMRAAHICAAHGVKFRLGAHVGSRLGNAAAMHLAAALPGIWYANELGEFARLLDDPFTGMEVTDGAVSLTDGPGCGVVPLY